MRGDRSEAERTPCAALAGFPRGRSGLIMQRPAHAATRLPPSFDHAAQPDHAARSAGIFTQQLVSAASDLTLQRAARWPKLACLLACVLADPAASRLITRQVMTLQHDMFPAHASRASRQHTVTPFLVRPTSPRYGSSEAGSVRGCVVVFSYSAAWSRLHLHTLS